MTAHRLTGIHPLPDGDRVRVQYRTEEGQRRQVTLRKSEGAGVLIFSPHPFTLTLAVKRLIEHRPDSELTYIGYLALPVGNLKVALLVKLLRLLPRVGGTA